jgi:6-phosphogluconolactonase
MRQVFPITQNGCKRSTRPQAESTGTYGRRKHMKLRHIGQAAWAGAVSVALVLGVAACGQDNTIDYLFVANSKNNPGQINVYLVDSESGSLKQILDSPYQSGQTNGGRNPVSLVTSPNQQYLYALNHDDNTIVKFGIGTDAKLYPQNTYNTPGSGPTSMKINAAGTYLYVLDAFQPGYSATLPGPGALIVYPINPDGTLGQALTDVANKSDFYPVCNNPVDLAVLPNNSGVYVVNDPASQPPKIADTVSSSFVGANGTATITYTASGACSADTGQISAFTVGSSGDLTQVAGSPFAAGSTPVAIASTPNSGSVYVADLVPGNLLAFNVGANNTLTSTGTLNIINGGGPDALTVDAAGQYLYVANYNANNVTTFTLSGTALPTQIADSGTFGVSTAPTYVFIEPSAKKYLYTSDFIDSTVYGTLINAQTGTLSAVEHTPFPAAGQPTAIAAIIHGKAFSN